MIQLYALHDNKKTKPNPCLSIKLDQAAEMNEKGYGIFFTPNEFKSTERREENLKRLRFYYIDMDGGAKDEMLDKILAFKLTPTWIVETKNGFHVYWKCLENDLVERNKTQDYLKVIERLVSHFDSDKNAKGTTRILRFPSFYHCKNPDRKFLIREVYKNESLRYSLEEMLNALPFEEKTETEKSASNIISKFDDDDLWKIIGDIDCVDGLSRLSGQPEVNGEIFSTVSAGKKKKILVNGEEIQSCWIDENGMIGSHDNGGPTIANWIHWYVKDWNIVATCLKRVFPEITQSLKLGESWDW